jgi:hypothetical protein
VQTTELGNLRRRYPLFLFPAATLPRSTANSSRLPILALGRRLPTEALRLAFFPDLSGVPCSVSPLLRRHVFGGLLPASPALLFEIL